VPIVLTDTAGLRETVDLVEALGVERSRDLIGTADLLIWLGDSDARPTHPQSIQLHPRCDLSERACAPSGSLAVSSLTGEGIRSLLERIAQLAATLLPSDGAIALNRRQSAELTVARDELQLAGLATDIVLVAEHLRSAREAFDRLTGRVGIEDVLDALFSRFCLGK
jgi:tRNA modification GTPase